MKTMIALALGLTVLASPAGATCMADASTKHLAGAAQTSFMNKCKADVTMQCEKGAVGKDGRVLAGAAKTSFMNRCVAEGVGP